MPGIKKNHVMIYNIKQLKYFKDMASFSLFFTSSRLQRREYQKHNLTY